MSPLSNPSGSAPAAATEDWEVLIDQDGSSIASWTVSGGTWSADAGGFIKQTDTTAAYRGLRYNSDIDCGLGLIVQFDVRFPTAATADRRAMVDFGGSGGISAVHEPFVGLGENTDNVWVQRGDQSTSAEAFTVNEDQWYTVMALFLDGMVTVLVDGVYVRTARVTGPASSSPADKFWLVNYTGEVHYRNVKVWRKALPVLP
jgi:hypothetical protein